MVNKPHKVVATRVVDIELSAITAIATVAVVFLSGLVLTSLSVKFESGWGDCSRTDKETGKPICSSHIKWEGWDAIPVEPIAGLIGVSATGYFAWKKSRLQITDVPDEPAEEEGAP